MNRANLFILFVIISNLCIAQQNVENIDFLSDNWKTLGSASVKESDSGFITLISEGVGIAYLDGLEFENGVIECDLYSPTQKAYLGLAFRIGELVNYECIYFQPHTSGKWDAIQYDPIFNSSATWQLYNGKDYQAVADIPVQEWFHVKLEVIDDIAIVYLNNNQNPSLSVKLKHDITSGAVGVFSYHPANFKNLKVTKYDPLSGSEKHHESNIKDESYISSWLISEPYDNYNQNKDIQVLNKSINKWHLIDAEDYLVNLNKHFVKTNTKNTVLAKVFINSKKTQSKKLYFGYSDKVRVCLNSEMLFEGDNSFVESGDYRDRGYVLENDKTIDVLFLEGENELIMEISEDKFGWGFIARISDLKGIEIRKKNE